MSDSDKDNVGKKKWQRRFPAVSLKSVVLFFLLVFVVYFIFFDEHNLISRFRNKHKIEVLTKEIEHYRKETETNRQKMNELKKKAEVLQAKVKKVPSSFAKVAKENSQDTASAIRGGDLGFFAKEEMVESFANKAFSMAPNTISEVVQTPYGFHIIMVTDRNEAGVLSFEQSKKDIINYLESLDKVDILKNKIETLRKDAKIEYYDEAYNPENIQKKIKESAKSNPAMQQFGEQNQKTNKK